MVPMSIKSFNARVTLSLVAQTKAAKSALERGIVN